MSSVLTQSSLCFSFSLVVQLAHPMTHHHARELRLHRTNLWWQVNASARVVFSRCPQQNGVEILSGHLYNIISNASTSVHRAIIVSAFQLPWFVFTATLKNISPTCRRSWKKWRHLQESNYHYCKRCLNTESYEQQVLQGTSLVMGSRSSLQALHFQALA